MMLTFEFLPPANEIWDNVLTSVCLFTGGSLYDVTSRVAGWPHIPSGGSLSRGYLFWVSLARALHCTGGGSLSETPWAEIPRLYIEERAVRIILECFLVL